MKKRKNKVESCWKFRISQKPQKQFNFYKIWKQMVEETRLKLSLMEWIKYADLVGPRTRVS